jgi:hypothetical protein
VRGDDVQARVLSAPVRVVGVVDLHGEAVAVLPYRQALYVQDVVRSSGS